MSKTKSYLFAFLLGLLTVIICLAIGDGLIGVAGTIKYIESENVYRLYINDPTGKIIFWCGLLLLPVFLAYWIRPRHTWINLPLFVLSWYMLSAVFGSDSNHYYLAHPPRGFMRFYEEFDPFVVAVFMWLTQLIVLLVVRGIIKLIRTLINRKDTTA